MATASYRPNDARQPDLDKKHYNGRFDCDTLEFMRETESGYDSRSLGMFTAKRSRNYFANSFRNFAIAVPDGVQSVSQVLQWNTNPPAVNSVSNSASV